MVYMEYMLARPEQARHEGRRAISVLAVRRQCLQQNLLFAPGPIGLHCAQDQPDRKCCDSARRKGESESGDHLSGVKRMAHHPIRTSVGYRASLSYH